MKELFMITVNDFFPVIAPGIINYKLLLSITITSFFPFATWAQYSNDTAQTTVWKLNKPNALAAYTPVILGNPASAGTDSAVAFNGIDDGIVIPSIPMEGWPAFTIEVLFKPAADGPVAPRFIHFQDTASNRGTFEIRLTQKGEWYMDTFLKNGDLAKTNRGLTLIDSSLLHPANDWYWVAMVYDGKTMSSYVNGKKELEGNIDFPPMTKGQIALGMRLNKVNWFKGMIKEIRFHPAPLNITLLQRL